HNLRMLIYNRLQKYHKAWPENSAAADYLKERKSLHLTNTAFPFPQAIKALYNDNRDRTLPINYLRFIKWRLSEWRG
ncbi:MAG: hypothetical protein ABII68_08905, partial [Pseudomonadota bacterium]